MLEIKDLFVSYGMMEVLHGISLKVEDRELYMHAIDASYGYEGYTAFRAEEI